MSVLITTRAELEAMQPDGNYLLANDIDLSAAPWTPLFSYLTPFVGTLDGGGFQITGMQIPNNSEGYIALIRQLGFDGESGGLIKNLRLMNVSVWTANTTLLTVAALVSVNRGTIENCRVSGSVSGGSYTGMLTASNYGSIDRCFTEGTVSNYNPYLGGLIGNNEVAGIVRHSYSTAQVNGYNHLGGLAGRNSSGKIIRCYSTGRVVGVSSIGGLVGSKNTTAPYEDTGNFWDTTTSQRPTSACGVGRTSAQMKTPSTFTGWDFNTVWGIHPTINNGYPYLQGFFDPPPALRRPSGLYVPLRKPTRIAGLLLKR